MFWLVLTGLILLTVIIASTTTSTDGKDDTLPEFDSSRGDPHIREMDAYQRQWRQATSMGGTPLRDAVYRVAGLRESAEQAEEGGGGGQGGLNTASTALARSTARSVGKLLNEVGREKQNDKVLREIHAEALRNMERSDMSAVEGRNTFISPR